VTPKRKASSSELTASQEKKRLCKTDSGEYVMVDHSESTSSSVLFTKNTKAIVWGLQHRAVQVSNTISKCRELYYSCYNYI